MSPLRIASSLPPVTSAHTARVQLHQHGICKSGRHRRLSAIELPRSQCTQGRRRRRRAGALGSVGSFAPRRRPSLAQSASRRSAVCITSFFSLSATSHVAFIKQCRVTPFCFAYPARGPLTPFRCSIARPPCPKLIHASCCSLIKLSSTFDDISSPQNQALRHASSIEPPSRSRHARSTSASGKVLHASIFLLYSATSASAGSTGTSPPIWAVCITSAPSFSLPVRHPGSMELTIGWYSRNAPK